MPTKKTDVGRSAPKGGIKARPDKPEKVSNTRGAKPVKNSKPKSAAVAKPAAAQKKNTKALKAKESSVPKKITTASSKGATAARKAVPAKAGKTASKASARSSAPKQVTRKVAGVAKPVTSATARKVVSPRPKRVEKAVAAEKPAASTVRPESEIHFSAPTDTREHYFREHRAQEWHAPSQELPHEYGDTRIVLLVRDPEWVFTYWEINDAARGEFGIPREGHGRRMVIRVYQITGRSWPEEGAHYCFDIDISPYASNWYVKLPEVGQRWCAELGVFDEEGIYVPICRSNFVATPRDTVSTETDADWMAVEETFRKLYSASGGEVLHEVRGSEVLVRSLEKDVTKLLRGEGLSSGLMGSGAIAKAPAKDFWLQVHTELILYGATDPEAGVTVQGRRIKLNADGTFSLRFALPDGEQVLEVHAVNKDGDMEKTITPVVKKTTV